MHDEQARLYRIFVRVPDSGEARVFYAWFTADEREEFRAELKDRGYSGVRFTPQK